jgi:PmbA protein
VSGVAGYFEQLEEALRAGRSGELSVRHLRLSWSEAETLSAGIRDSEAAGVHSPFASATMRSGSYLLEWSDGRLSRGNVDGSTLANVEEVMEAAAASRVDDPEGANFPGPEEVPDVPLHSEEVGRLIDEDPSHLAASLSLLTERGAARGVKVLSGGVSAARGRTGVWSSEGLRIETPHTRFTFSSFLDGDVYEWFSWRKVFSLEEMTRRLMLQEELHRSTRRDLPWGERRAATVVLHPHVAEELLDHFVLGNLEGSAVEQGRSPWSPADFEDGSRVFRDDFRLAVDPLRPYASGSYRFTREGVPAALCDYITEGRLREPVLDRKHARKLGRRPTPAPASGESLVLEAGEPVPWEDLRGGIGDGVLVLSVLGTHTQDRARGAYSLASPTSVLCRDGEAVGKVQVVLHDDFFENLRSPELRTVHFPYHDLPGLAFPSVVSPDKG